MREAMSGIVDIYNEANDREYYHRVDELVSACVEHLGKRGIKASNASKESNALKEAKHCIDKMSIGEDCLIDEGSGEEDCWQLLNKDHRKDAWPRLRKKLGI
jgi:hypothetical protein